MNKTALLKQLNSLINKPFETWGLYGVNLRAVSATADGIVFSGLTSERLYFHRVYSSGAVMFVIED